MFRWIKHAGFRQTILIAEEWRILITEE